MSLLRLLTEDSWLLRLATNHIGYISFAIPLAVLFLVSKKSAYTRLPHPLRWVLASLIRLFISDASHVSSLELGANKDASISSSPASSFTPSSSSQSSNFTRRRIIRLLFSFFGLQSSYLIWGLLQERIMTRTYANEQFTNSQYLVFINRFLAMIIAYLAFKMFYPTKHLISSGPPLYQYGVISYANCMSTWFQYESLLYISFPVQVIAKSIKTIPVMFVGRFVSGKTYPLRQYLLMFIMAGGIALFLFGYQEHNPMKLGLKTPTKQMQRITTLSGVILLCCYLGFDAFTSNYQKFVFDRYSISFLHMMFHVNFLSTILTLTSLIINGTLVECISFMQRHEIFAIHVLATSICSSIGQLFIFSTIEEFGPVIFTIIMTIRQAFSILLSCVFYEHHLRWFSIAGIQVAFIALFIHAFIQFKRSKPSNTCLS